MFLQTLCMYRLIFSVELEKKDTIKCFFILSKITDSFIKINLKIRLKNSHGLKQDGRFMHTGKSLESEVKSKLRKLTDPLSFRAKGNSSLEHRGNFPFSH